MQNAEEEMMRIAMEESRKGNAMQDEEAMLKLAMEESRK